MSEHKLNIINLFYVDEKSIINLFIFDNIILYRVCCSFCNYKNLHPQHKILEFNDEEALKKENINIDNSTKELDEKSKN